MSEKTIAKKIGAELVKNSGRGFRKGDMILEEKHSHPYKFLIDAKEGTSFVLTKNAWAKVCSDAWSWGRDYEPMILRAFDDGTLVACISYDFLIELLESGDYA